VPPIDTLFGVGHDVAPANSSCSSFCRGLIFRSPKFLSVSRVAVRGSVPLIVKFNPQLTCSCSIYRTCSITAITLGCRVRTTASSRRSSTGSLWHRRHIRVCLSQSRLGLSHSRQQQCRQPLDRRHRCRHQFTAAVMGFHHNRASCRAQQRPALLPWTLSQLLWGWGNGSSSSNSSSRLPQRMPSLRAAECRRVCTRRFRRRQCPHRFRSLRCSLHRGQGVPSKAWVTLRRSRRGPLGLPCSTAATIQGQDSHRSRSGCHRLYCTGRWAHSSSWDPVSTAGSASVGGCSISQLNGSLGGTLSRHTRQRPAWPRSSPSMMAPRQWVLRRAM